LKVDQVIEDSTDPHTLHFSLSPLRAANHKVCACYSAPARLHVLSAAASEECDGASTQFFSKLVTHIVRESRKDQEQGGE
jgi:hypothetical protein